MALVDHCLVAAYWTTLASNPSVGYSPSASMGASYAPASSNTSAFTPPPLSAGSGGRGGGISPNSATYPHGHSHHQHQLSGQGSSLGTATGTGGQPNQLPNIDYEQAGVDFVLTLENPCMNHLPWMLERAVTTGIREPCGHALMASCPPEPFSELSPDIPFGQQPQAQNGSGGGHTHPHNHAPAEHPGPNPSPGTGAVPGRGRRHVEAQQGRSNDAAGPQQAAEPGRRDHPRHGLGHGARAPAPRRAAPGGLCAPGRGARREGALLWVWRRHGGV
ncbi:hypothetical protein CHGG_05978 [Chaetomium globosum CBS 148.51]|uniref:Uncharacterized protein n=1 Tax=Chaetomium globosum (strain ATCC 6205 / CBS 148.51 / DSM 1962 / NBRC 6347 / NRRL 1970) TaxID=306901 RepID=Q2H5T7_CHAGB|nr:uncharacterized protein CHGG_05978 [Chaetomium globosum CBS 148.51]EAQ89359.1 hypothetical protein CHGG_05978 [Chaetomium globosum CBS 148.51]